RSCAVCLGRYLGASPAANGSLRCGGSHAGGSGRVGCTRKQINKLPLFSNPPPNGVLCRSGVRRVSVSTEEGGPLRTSQSPAGVYPSIVVVALFSSAIFSLEVG